MGAVVYKNSGFNFQEYRTMVTVLYIMIDIGVYQLRFQRIGYRKVVNSPALIVQPHSGKTLAPPAIPVWL